MRLDVMWRRDEYDLVSWWPRRPGMGWGLGVLPSLAF